MSRALPRMPTRFELSAALQVAQLVGPEGVDDATLVASFEQIVSGGMIRGDHLKEATRLLALGGQLARTADGWAADSALGTLAALPHEEALIALAGLMLEAAPPMWLAGATGGAFLNPDLVPDADWKACCDAITDPDRREAMLLSAGRRYEEAAAFGLDELGASAVSTACRDRLDELGRSDLAAKVLQVADGQRLGYDVITPATAGGVWRLKVKTARRALPQLMLTVHRHEILAGLASTGWALVACVANPDNSVRIGGWCNSEQILGHLPDDLPGRGEWATARLFLDEQDLSSGLPDLGHAPS